MFLLNTRLAEAESMTHDVIRDLVGVKKDLTSFTVHTPINFISACMLISIEFYTCSLISLLMCGTVNVGQTAGPAAC